MMDEKERELVRQRLEAELTEARAELERLEQKLQVEVEYGLGEGDPSIYEREINLALRRRTRRKVRALEEASQRFEEGTYGVCERCGRQIGAERLEIMPQARLCIQCAEQSGG
ncbi:MAG: TraR/DksA C4-type zinc finger protein [Anaerolineae bacterium]|nr:TraR/DksA C4-type zinc finger protein [Anaerolineae bacterium]